MNSLGILYVADTGYNRIQVFAPAAAGELAPKAIIVAGSGPYLGNAIWDETEKLAHRVFSALRRQGYVKDQVTYLTAGNTRQDLDGNEYFDDLSQATLDNLQHSLTTWAADAESVVLYLVGHGGEGTFRMNIEYEVLTSDDLATWLGALQIAIPGPVMVIIEACHAASFLPSIANSERVLITSAGTAERAQIHPGGLSFSYYFWTEVGYGNDLGGAFEIATAGVDNLAPTAFPQNPVAESDGDGIHTREDLRPLGDLCLGNCISTVSGIPELRAIMNDEVLAGGYAQSSGRRSIACTP